MKIILTAAGVLVFIVGAVAGVFWLLYKAFDDNNWEG